MYSLRAFPQPYEKSLADARRKKSKALRDGDTKAADKADAEILFLQLQQQIRIKGAFLTINQRRALIEELIEFDRRAVI